MITPELKQKLAKVYELVNRGATDGEKTAAKKALERLMEKHGIREEDLDNLKKGKFFFKYSSDLDLWLLSRLVHFFIDNPDEVINGGYRSSYGGKDVCFWLTYLDSVTIECAYGYFKRHMNAQWKKFCLSNLRRCKTTKSRNKRRKELQNVFFDRYIIASHLYDPKRLVAVNWDDLSKQEQKDRVKLSEIEGGKYNRQMTSGLLIEN
jgi:hypothetical protein